MFMFVVGRRTLYVSVSDVVGWIDGKPGASKGQFLLGQVYPDWDIASGNNLALVIRQVIRSDRHTNKPDAVNPRGAIQPHPVPWMLFFFFFSTLLPGHEQLCDYPKMNLVKFYQLPSSQGLVNMATNLHFPENTPLLTSPNQSLRNCIHIQNLHYINNNRYKF